VAALIIVSAIEQKNGEAFGVRYRLEPHSKGFAVSIYAHTSFSSKEWRRIAVNGRNAENVAATTV
jgi:hypothetical protein